MITACTPCNNAIGRDAEMPLMADLEILRNLLNVQKTTGRQRQPPTLRGVSSPVGSLDVLPGGQLARSSKTMLRSEKEGGFTIEGPDSQQVVHRLMHYLRELGVKPTDDIRSKLHLNQSNLEITFPQIILQGGIGGEAQMRAIAKIGFEFFAMHRREEIHDARLDRVRRFVRLGESDDCAAWDAQNQPDLPFDADELGPAYHSIVVWAAAESAPLVAAITLFGVLHWTVELARSWWCGPFGFAHAVDPLRGNNLGDRAVIPLPLAPGWKAARFTDGDRIMDGLNKLQQYWRTQQRDQMIHAAVTRIMADAADGGDSIEGERLQRMFNRLADWMAHYQLGVPLRTSEDVEETIRQVEKEYPAFCAKLEQR